MTLPIRVLGPRVLIQVDIQSQDVEQTESGILIAKTMAAAIDGSDSHESWYEGTVIATGDDAFDVRPYVLRRLNEAVDDGGLSFVQLKDLIDDIEQLPTERTRDFSIGDRVTFSHVAGEQIDIDGQRYLILKESEILGVLEDYAV